MNQNAIPEMIEWLRKVGYQVDATRRQRQTKFIAEEFSFIAI